MSDDLVKRLREGTNGTDVTKTDAVLTSYMHEAAARIEALEAEIKLHEECATIVHFQGVRYASENMAEAIWEAHKHWDGEKKFAIRKVVAFLRGQKNAPSGGTPEAVSRHRADGSGDSD